MEIDWLELDTMQMMYWKKVMDKWDRNTDKELFQATSKNSW